MITNNMIDLRERVFSYPLALELAESLGPLDQLWLRRADELRIIEGGIHARSWIEGLLVNGEADGCIEFPFTWDRVRRALRDGFQPYRIYSW